MTGELLVTFDANGDLLFVHDDALADLLDEGVSEVRRASNVDPASGGGWVADMAPSGGPLLGPFRLRGQALNAEREWLRENIGL